MSNESLFGKPGSTSASNADDVSGDDAGLEELLREVGARAEPSAEIMDQVRQAVHAEWRQVIAARERRRRFVGFGVAASFAGMVAVAAFMLRTTTIEPVTVATITRMEGHVQVRNAAATRELTVGESIVNGETLQTDAQTRVALDFGKGLSVRIDRGSSIAIAAADHIILNRGALYVDSGGDATRGVPLTVETAVGAVRHLGTQYQVRTVADDIEVSIREGRVQIANTHGNNIGSAGERLRVSSLGNIERSSISARDASWNWAANTAPRFDIDNQTADAFLQWVARETGRKVQYANDAAKAAAQSKLRGSIAVLDPETALDSVLLTLPRLRRYKTADEFIGIALASAIESKSQDRPIL